MDNETTPATEPTDAALSGTTAATNESPSETGATAAEATPVAASAETAAEQTDEVAVSELTTTTLPFDREELDDPNKKWYVVSAQAGREKNAESSLRDRIEISEHRDKFGPILVPSEEVVELRAGKRRRSVRRFYPGYIFIFMEMDESTWEIVSKSPRITGFIGGKIGDPTPLPKKEIDLILDRIDQGGEKVTPKTVFEPGELIRIIDGPFNEFSGTVEEVNYKKQQLVVAVTIFGRSTPVELDFSQVEKG